MVVAVAIFAVMSGMAYRVLTTVLESRNRVDAEQQKWRAVAIMFARLEQDLGSIRLRAARDPGGNKAAPLVGLQVPRANEGHLMFSRAGYVTEGGTPGSPQRVGYRLRDTTLEYMTWPALDQAPRSEPALTPLLTGVSTIRLRYMDLNGQWQDRWQMTPLLEGTPDNIPDLMPRLIEFELGLLSGERIRRVFAPFAGGLPLQRTAPQT
jgi:general secretion pathway protein J